MSQEKAELRTKLETQGQVWDTTQLQQDFVVEGFSMGFVVVKRKADGQRGSLDFEHSPRLYHNFKEA
jgi:hypothetical protein